MEVARLNAVYAPASAIYHVQEIYVLKGEDLMLAICDSGQHQGAMDL